MAAKTALITGASRGIGRAIALQLAQGGFRIGLHYRTNAAAAADTLAALEGSGHHLLAADLAQAESSRLLAEAALDQLGGRVDVLVHNAGVYLETPIFEGGLQKWSGSLREMMQLNFLAGADLAQRLAPAMAAHGWGRIIQVASRSGLRGESRYSGYAASKAAQIAFNKSLAVELGPSGVGCFALAPGWVATDMSADAIARDEAAIRASIPAGRIAKPEDIAALVGWLVTPAADYLTGNTIDVNGASFLG